MTRENEKTAMKTKDHQNSGSNQLKVYTSAILFSLIVGFSFLGVKTSISTATPMETLTYRFNFAFIAVLIPFLLGFIKINVKEKPRKKLAFTAGFYIAFMFFQAVGLLFSTTIESGIIFAVVPIIAKVIAGALLKENTSWKQNIFVCVSVTAVITMFVMGATDITVNIIGLVFLMISSICMAISNVMMRYVRADFRPIEISFFITGGGCLLFNLITLVQGLQTGTLADYFLPLSNWSFTLATAYLGIPSTLISAMLMSYMLANMEAVKATIFGNLSTAISIVAGVLILHEPLAVYHVICTLLIIIGVIGVSLPSMAKKEDTNLD